ncbi:ATP-dependent protease ATPase subunit HslU [Candidatus Zinderia endosymbiont of Aphrophora alni]|uniref:ATP-dependent protease ATPase subunit HslU n=1 Tax=Candidatus Zinderia endosymbiont of Aphrophora alni TaxID=3077951 RepID=UPI0030D58719
MNIVPKKMLLELDKRVIGQKNAKKAIVIAIYNRYSRLKIKEPLRSEIIPKNVLMIGPTGVGKTEIARNIAKITNSPFIKVEITKYTEVGYVGKDVESIIKELLEVGIKQEKELEIKKKKKIALDIVEEKIVNLLMISENFKIDFFEEHEKKFLLKICKNTFIYNKVIKFFLKKKVREKKFHDKFIKMEVLETNDQMEILLPFSNNNIVKEIKTVFSNFKDSYVKKDIKIKDIFKSLLDEEIKKLLDFKKINLKAIARVEQKGIVFLDEIDKIISKSYNNIDVSRFGVQRDLLSLVEGTIVNTKYGTVKTDFILFIASGAFHFSEPSDLIPELQGRFPIKVKLEHLTRKDFVKILTVKENSLIKQYKAILKVEGIKANFTLDGIKKIANIAFLINEKTENIGARCLFTVMEKLLEKILFSISNFKEKNVLIDKFFVKKCLKKLIIFEDLSKNII